MSEDLKHITTDLIHSEVLPSHIKLSKVVSVLDNPKYNRNSLRRVEIREELGAIRKGKLYYFDTIKVIDLLINSRAEGGDI